jgi:hypothetical protein
MMKELFFLVNTTNGVYNEGVSKPIGFWDRLEFFEAGKKPGV